MDIDDLGWDDPEPREQPKWVEQSVTAKFELTLDTVLGTREDGPYTVGDAIIDAAARQLANEAKHQAATGHGYYRRVHEKVESALDEKAAELIDQLWEREVTKSDRFGKATGEPLSLEAWAAERIEKWLNAPQGDGYGRTPTSRVQQAVEKVLDRRLSKELEQAIDGAKMQALAAVTEVAEKHLTAALRETIATAAQKGR